MYNQRIGFCMFIEMDTWEFVGRAMHLGPPCFYTICQDQTRKYSIFACPAINEVILFAFF